MSINVEFMNSAQERATDWSELWHPYVVLYGLQTVVAVVAMFVSLRFPKALIVIMILSGLVFVISWLADQPAWGYKALTYIWIGVLIKWLIVNAFATVPVLYLHAFKPGVRTTRMIGYFVYTILGMNILWTLGLDSNRHVVAYLNGATAVMLTISLLIHCLALHRHGQEFYEVRHSFPYGFGTTFPWLVCYTVWNALFTAKISLGTTLQDALFWGMMFGMQKLDNLAQPIELYFGFARPVQLGAYIAFSEWMGTFVPWFYEAKPLTEHQPLPVNSHSYFFFIVCCNLILSVICTVWASYRFCNGLGSFAHRYILSQQREHDVQQVSTDKNKAEDPEVANVSANAVGVRSI